MSAIVPIANGSALPAYLANRAALASINDEINLPSGFPVLSIKGKVFTLVKDGEKKVLTRADDPDETLQSLTLSVVRANTNSRVFYAKNYEEGDSDGAKPDCYSNNGTTPAPDSRNPQATKCATCAHAVWGTGKEGKGTACTVNTRLAVVDPEVAKLSDPEPYLLRVPAGSRANFADIVKVAKNRGIPYNALALKVAFDPTAPAPKLTFKLIGFVDDDVYAKVNGLRDNETVLEIVGLQQRAHTEAVPAAAPSVTEADLEAALAIKAAKTKAEAPKPAPEPAVAPAAEVKPAKSAKAEKPAKAAKPAATESVDNLLDDLDTLLGDTDD